MENRNSEIQKILIFGLNFGLMCFLIYLGLIKVKEHAKIEKFIFQLFVYNAMINKQTKRE